MKHYLANLDPAVRSMALLRLLSASIEMTAAILMLIFNDVRKAVLINSMLAIVGPIIFILTMTIGIFQIAEQLSYAKLIFIAIGVAFILIGVYK
ncbi:YqhV family protein [Metabacillus idriensis]|uniref:YqhV family protein n=1 Tax=Metabacillus idriensis TaxID=324768 RepID=UPI002813E848|nr:YqhV family protein [Metabacillus idriensis]MDR0138413.1 YqhV family protein [Metabacillus idriensis]